MSSASRYERQEQIGSGTFGHAWLVRSRASGRHYVVKEIKVTSLPEQEREQSVNEVAILSQCKHVNIIRYKEAFIDQGTGSLNIVMEYADGGDLYARIVSQRATDDHFPEELILNWFIQITFAVQYLHSKNILHRDLKTQNIFLTSENLVKVGDFGIARTLRSTQELATTAIGTPYYLSPEICQRQPYNHKSDQWAVGCIVYEMCCLTHPFNASSFENLVLKILQARYNPIPSHYSLLLRDLVTVLLRTQPERRPSAEQVLMIPALKPYVDSYVEWQNAVMSPRGSHRTTGGSGNGSSNGSDDRDSLTSSQEDICVSSMTADSLETPVAAETAPPAASEPAPAPVPETQQDGRAGRHAARSWRSQYANQLAEREDERTGASTERAAKELAPPPSAPAVARRRSEDAGSPTGRSSDASGPRPRSYSLSSLSPDSPRDREADEDPILHTPAAAKIKGRGPAGRGPSALIRQVLKNKFTRQEARPRSASDPADPAEQASSSEPRSCPRRERSPAKVFRRPSLSLARGGSPRSPRPHSTAGRSRSPVPQARSPTMAIVARGSPPAVRRNARFLDAPTPRSSGASIARPVERRPVSRTGSTISATSNMSTNGSSSVRDQQQADSAASSSIRGQHGTAGRGDAVSGTDSGNGGSRSSGVSSTRGQREVAVHSAGPIASDATKSQQKQQQQQQQQQVPRSDSWVSSSSSQQRPSARRQMTAEPQQHKDGQRTGGGGSPKVDQTCPEENDWDSDSQESTLVNMPISHLPDINHNNIQIAGGQLHARSAECGGSTCCSLICAQCRYAKDEQLARLMWAARIRPDAATDEAKLLEQLGKILGAERLNAALGRLLAGWDSADACWSDELLLALGREHVHLLPLLVQAVQLRGVAGRGPAGPYTGDKSPGDKPRR